MKKKNKKNFSKPIFIKKQKFYNFILILKKNVNLKIKFLNEINEMF